MNGKLNDFEKFALSKGVSTNTLNGFNNYSMRGGYMNPYIIEERPLNAVTIDVFSRLMSDKIIFVGCEICPESANIINAQLLYLNSICDKDEDVKLFINTPGGDVDSGLAIVDTMNFIVPDISTIVMGMSASMGSIISSSGTRGKRFILPHSKILIHQPMGGVAPGTQESDFAIAYEQIKQCKDVLYKILAENTGKTVEEITADADRDHWLTAEESLPGAYGKYGLVDKIKQKYE